MLAVLFTIVGQVVSLTCKVLYVLVMVVLPTWMMKRVHVDAFDYMVQILFFLSCLMGPLQDSVVFQVTKEKFTCIRYMKMELRKQSKRFYVTGTYRLRFISHCGSGRRLVPGRECVERHLSVACDCDVPGSGRGVPGMVF